MPSPPSSQAKSRSLLIPLLVAFALLVKVALLLTLSDVFFYGEELEKATAAKGMLESVPIEHHKLAYHYYEGGGFVISHLKAVAFWLVGPTYLANKLVSLGAIALVLTVALMFLRRHFSDQAVFWFGLLFVFAPESFQKLPLLSLGIHFEACVFVFLMFDLTLAILFQRERRFSRFFLLGLVAGLGTYFSYQVLPAAGFCGLYLAVLKSRHVFGPRGLSGLAGFALGLAPLVWMYTLVGDAIFDVHGTALVGGTDFGANSIRAREFLLSVFVDKSPQELLLPVAYVVGTAFATFSLSREHDHDRHVQRGPALFLVFFVGFWLFTYAISPFVQGHAYYYYYFNRFLPFWMTATMLIAIWIGRMRLSEESLTRRMGLFIGTLLVMFGVYSTQRVIAEGRPTHIPENFEILTRTRGYTYAAYFAKLKHHLSGTLEEKLDSVAEFGDDDRLLYPAIALEFLTPEQLSAEGEIGFEDLLDRMESWNAEALPQLMRGLGPFIYPRTNGDLAASLRSIQGFEERHRIPLWEAVGRYGNGFLHAIHGPEQVRAEVHAGLGQPGAEHYFFGIGERVYSIFRIRPDQAREFIETLPQEARPAVHRGYEDARELRLLE